ncbi:isocitrate lyase/PEP mutase family protein [Streptomyces sp. NPDC050508]|uniref:isocitrate lyase/PEP mutase family protein n=1 Tax=Streptomyces sp. NPDC050508 TaxID=3155405 RepID=UPI00341EA1E4
MSSLTSLINNRHPLVAPSIYDGISALAAKAAGFEAAYIGSWATGATKYGLPDIGFISLDDMADQVRRLAAAAQMPLVVDGEGGWGNPLHVARAIRVLEEAGAAAIHLEDHEFGKHLGARKVILPLDKAVDKLKAALDARDSEDLLIIARTDAAGTEGMNAAIDRLLAYQEAGASAVMMSGIPDEPDAARLRQEVSVPIFALDRLGSTTAALGKHADVIIYLALTQLAAKASIEQALQALAQDGIAPEPEGGYDAYLEFDSFLGITEERAKAQRYGLLG